MEILLAQFPALSRGEIETWLLCAAAAGALLLIGRKLILQKPELESEFVTKDEFREFRTSVEQDLNGLRDRIDTRHLAVLQSIEQVKSAVLADGERRSGAVLARLGQVESLVARVDERTRGKS